MVNVPVTPPSSPVSFTNNDPNTTPADGVIYVSGVNGYNYYNVTSTTPEVFQYLTLNNDSSSTDLVTINVTTGTLSLFNTAYSNEVTVISPTEVQFTAANANNIFSSGTVLYTPTLGQVDHVSVTVGVTKNGITGPITDSFTIQCFVAGTMIACPEGERAVETLAVGDLVLNAAGAACPVRFLGRRALDLTVAREHAPVLIPAGAIADGVPSRDLRVSPDHAIAIDGVLVTARALLGGPIRQDFVESVVYCHIQLDGHDVVIANGTPCETLLDAEDPVGFDNAEEAVITDVFLAPCLPRVSQGEAVEAIRAKINARALATV